MKKRSIFSSLGFAPLLVRRRAAQRDARVSFDGAPTYISEFQDTYRDNGGPLSPYGSHVGVKAVVENLGFAGLHHYGCATGAHMLDYSRTGWFADTWLDFLMDDAPQTASRRAIHFESYGWQEEAAFGLFRATNAISFAACDHYELAVELENTQTAPLELRPVLHLAGQGRRFRRLQHERGALRLAVQVNPLIWGQTAFLRIEARPPELSVQVSGKHIQARWPLIHLQPGERASLGLAFHFSLDETQAAEVAGSVFTVPGLAAVRQRADQARRDLEAALPAPHLPAEDSTAREMYLTAAAGLDQTLYAPRGRMIHWGTMPNKVHYSMFCLWDTGFNAIGLSEFRPQTAWETLQTQFAAMRPDGFLAHMVNDQLRGLTPHSMAPVFGFSVDHLKQRLPAGPQVRALLEESFRFSQTFLGWWDAHRDHNHNGLYEYLSVDEGGGDNSPRANYVPKGLFINYYGYLGELIASRLRPLDSVDLNSWMYRYFHAMAGWAQALGRESARRSWAARAQALGQKMDDVLWDETAGCWLDAYAVRGDPSPRHFRTLTPYAWFPAFTGATRSEAKARRAIQEHLLNPREFFGPFPIPSVAYNDAYFQPEVPGWVGSIWLCLAYPALETLSKFGYSAEAHELKRRLIRMVCDQGEMKGVYETYDPLTGKYRRPDSNGYYCCFQYGWSGAFLLETMLDRFEEERFIFPDTTRISGFIRQGIDFATRAEIYTLTAGRDVPHLDLESADGSPLLQAARVRLVLSDPYGAFAPGSVFAVSWRGQTYRVSLDQPQVLERDVLISGSV